ncbi:MAG: efflux RND transporter periplasmic adaptor subunit [Fusobacteriota bacterium]
MKKILITLLILVTFIGCGEKPEETKEKEEVKAVRTGTLKREEISKTIKIGGTIDSFKEVVHAASLGGEVEKVHIVNGRWVKEGDLIVTLENKQVESSYMQAKANFLNAESAYERAKKFAKDELENRLSQAKMAKTSAEMNLQKARKGSKEEELEQAEYRLESAKNNYEVAKSNYEKNKRLYEKELISEMEFQNIESAYKAALSNYKTAENSLELMRMGADVEDLSTLEAQVENAQANYNLTKKMVDEKAWKYDIQAAESGYLQAKSNYELAKDNYDDLTVEAEISGVIINLDLEEKNGVKPDSVLFSVINNDDMIMEIGIPEKDVEGIQKFNKTTVYVEAIDTIYDGTVYEINPAADPRTKKFGAKIKIKNRGHKIKKGMYGNATIDSGKNEVLVVDKKAIVVQGVESYIFIVGEDNRVKKVEVSQGIENDNLVEVKSEKLSSGDKVVVEGQFVLENNDKVSEVK